MLDDIDLFPPLPPLETNEDEKTSLNHPTVQEI